MSKDNIEQKVDRTALIQDMQAAVSLAAHRWEEVCRVYGAAWDEAFDNHVKALNEVRGIKEARAKAVADRMKTCLELASVFLPVIGGEIALTITPILTTRAKLFVNTMEKKAQTSWKNFAASRPITSQVVKRIGDTAKGSVKEATAAIEKDIMDQLKPSFPKELQAPPSKNPVEALIDNNSIVEDRMLVWVKMCSGWNVAGDWQKELVPVAHDMLLNHPWVKDAPTPELTQSMRPQLARFIELALWFRWAKQLDENYWFRVHDWYEKENRRASRDVRDIQARGRARHMSIDALDHKRVLQRIENVYPGARFIPFKMKILDPESGLILAEDETIDLWVLIKYAKHTRSESMLQEVVPKAKINSELLRELRKM